MRSCPALFISAPASGQGKTTVTAALARFHRDQGRLTASYLRLYFPFNPKASAQLFLS